MCESYSLQIRFRQNQEDCTYTVLALLPTANENVLRALPVEELLGELQARKTEKLTRGGAASTTTSEFAPSEIGTEEGSAGTGSFIHASQQMTGGEQEIDGSGETKPAPKRDIVPSKSKTLLWNELKITCMPFFPWPRVLRTSIPSNVSQQQSLEP